MPGQPRSSVPCRSPWAAPAAAAAVVAAAAHVPVTGPHLEEVPYLGWLFVALEVALLGLAVLLVRRDTPVVWWLAGLTAGAALAGYVTSRTVGLPGATDDIGDWDEPLGVVSIAAEAVLLVLVLLHRWQPHTLLAVGRPRVVAVALLAVGGLLVASAAIAEPSGHGMAERGAAGMLTRYRVS